MNFSNKGWRAGGTGQIAGHVASRLRTPQPPALAGRSGRTFAPLPRCVERGEDRLVEFGADFHFGPDLGPGLAIIHDSNARSVPPFWARFSITSKAPISADWSAGIGSTEAGVQSRNFHDDAPSRCRIRAPTRAEGSKFTAFTATVVLGGSSDTRSG